MVPRLSWARADHALTEIDVAPREAEDLLDPHPAEHSECEQRPIPRRATVKEPPDLVRGQGPLPCPVFRLDSAEPLPRRRDAVTGWLNSGIVNE